MSRRDIHYWKCDRPAAFHGTHVRDGQESTVEGLLREAMQEHFHTTRVSLTVAATQGNHLTWNAVVDDAAMFIRVENGPEGDSHLELESAVMRAVRAAGVPVPEVFAVAADRTRVPFAWQAMERIPFPDLNHWHKQGSLDCSRVAFEIGAAVARWQCIKPAGFGAFDPEPWRTRHQLAAFHACYVDYFRLRLAPHLGFLSERGFLSTGQCGEIERVIAQHEDLLHLDHGCLVHKDLALWNILGSQDHIAAFIDFDDAISGDCMDDLSLLACFHDSGFVARAFEGYQSVAPLPEDHIRRFWLHLLRNIIVKAVIRVGAGYFERSDSFFLIGAGRDGADLERFTHNRISLALQGLATNANLTIL